MKKTLWAVLALTLCLLLVLGGCQRTESARETFERGEGPTDQSGSAGESGEEPPQQDQPAEDDTDYDWYAQRYVSSLSLQRMEDFASPAEIDPDDLVAFFFMANYDGEDKLPIPEGYRSSTDGSLLLPAAEVESFVAALMEGIEESDLRASSFYDPEKEIYAPQGFGVTSGGSRVQVTDVRQQGDRVELVFDVYALVTDAEGETTEIGPTATRSASFLDQGDRFQVSSLATLYQADMDKLMQEAGLA